MRDLAVAEGADLFHGAAFAIAQPYPRAQLLAILGVRHADHLHVLHLGMAIQEFLDLARVDVLAAADHHVLHPADDVAVAVIVQHR
ncbi:hypothetical protein D3C72_2197900 [compost metagenome]